MIENCAQGGSLRIRSALIGGRSILYSDFERRELATGFAAECDESGTIGARKMKRAQILLKADEGMKDEAITVALNADRHPGSKTKIDGRAEAHLIALACSDAPYGHERWTLRLLADKLVELGIVDEISHETVRQRLKKMA
jgi:hypothetical protein